MAKLQQLVVQTVIAVLVFGGVACLCPAAVGAEGMSPAAHGHHQHGTTSSDRTRQEGDCGHEDCEVGCESVSAAASKGIGSASGKTGYQVDGMGVPPSDLLVFTPFPGRLISVGPSRLLASLPQETPVQRCDQLLD